jgi:hypothetical protein
MSYPGHGVIKVYTLISILVSPVVIDRCLQGLWQQVLRRYFGRLVGIGVHLFEIAGARPDGDQQSNSGNEIFYRNFHDACGLEFNIYTKANASGAGQLAAVESHIGAAYLRIYVPGILMEYGQVPSNGRDANCLQEVLLEPSCR